MATGRPFEPGNPGRPKGAKNKVNNTIRAKFEQLLDEIGYEQIKADLMSLKPAERLNVITGLAEFITPKLARTQMEHSAEEEIEGFQITIKRREDQ